MGSCFCKVYLSQASFSKEILFICTMKFILLFLLLNSLFFIPRYILERKTSTFFPYRGFLSGPVKERIQFVINRFNYDIFRVSVDFLFLSILLLIVKGRVPQETLHPGIFIIYLLLMIYQVYYHAFENIYKVEPLFYRDYLLLKTGLQIFFREFNAINILLATGVVSLFTGIYLLIGLFVESALAFQPGFIFWSIAGLLVLLSFYSLFTYNYKAFGKIVFPSQFQSLIRNISFSLATKKQIGKVDFEKLKSYRPYQGLQLKFTPNIYFIPIESYGRILYDHEGLKVAYKDYMHQMQESLQNAQWYSATNLSLSPITGGASWVSYSSAMFGMDVKDQGVYLTLLNRPEMHEYQHLMRWLKSNGYTNYRVAPIAGFKGMKIPWETYSSFYAIDDWIKYEDMNYTGPLIGFGPCPPDQYSLGFAKDYISKKQASPFCLFFITQNSHSPFNNPGEVRNKWSDWSDGTQVFQGSSSIFVNPKLEDYAKAIQYQMTFLTDFILKEGSENDVFLLIGDHQPPTFPGPEDGLETPIHIISKNEAFVKSFESYGFEKGLHKPNMEGFIRHESVYSMLVRELLRYYGKENEELPDFKPEGVDWLKD